MSDKPSGEIVLYQRSGDASAIEVRLGGDTVGLSQQQLADLFGTSKQNICHHIGNVLEEGELLREATVKEYLTVRWERKIEGKKRR